MAQVRVLDGADLAGIVEGFASLEWTRPYTTSGRCSLTIPRAAFDAATLVRGRNIAPPDAAGLVYRIEQIETTRDDRGLATMTVAGRDLGGYAAERDCEPPAGLMHDTQSGVAPETALKHYFAANIVNPVRPARRIPGYAVAPDRGRPAGVVRTYQARYQYLGDLLAEICAPDGLGWQVTLDGATGLYTFDIIAGRDRAAEAGVVFDVAFDSATGASWLASDLDTKTVARVLGQGDGAARAQELVWLGQDEGAPEPAGFARRELPIDARDLTTAAGLRQRGRAKLAEARAVDRFEVAVNPAGSFRYRDPDGWDLGDVVLVRDRDWGIEQTARVVGVTSRITAERGDTPTITAILGRAWPTLRERLAGGTIGSGSTRD